MVYLLLLVRPTAFPKTKYAEDMYGETCKFYMHTKSTIAAAVGRTAVKPSRLFEGRVAVTVTCGDKRRG